MNDDSMPPSANDPGSMTLPPPVEGSRSRSGCMKWGLVGCAGLSVLLIVGLIFVGTKGVDLLFGKIQDSILSSCTADVTQEQKAEFQAAYAPFIAKAKKGAIPGDKMTAFRTKMTSALADGKVTPEEITDLTNGLKEMTK